MRNLDDFLAGADSAAIAGHIRPDGDCVGSCLAVYNYIRTCYPDMEVSLYLEPIPNIFKFMKSSDEIKNECVDEKSYDLFFVLDCGDAGRLGEAVKYFHTAKKTVCIDHHISNVSFADENYIFPQASSTSELVFELLPKERITKEIAECIYTGIVHDTGVFQYSCTSKKTMEAASCLMERGIDFTKIIDETYYAKTFEQNRILGLALLKAKLYADGQIIASVITKKEMDRYQVLPKHLDGIVNQLRITKGVEAAVFLYETEEGEYKVSMRSVSFVDVAGIAVAFGGGGHVRAAGYSMTGESDQIIQQAVTEMEKQLTRQGQ